MRETALEQRVGQAVFEYSFAKHGGVVGTITVGPKMLPKGAIIHDGFIHVKTAVTSGGAATLQIMAVGADDIRASTAKATLSLNAILDVVPDGAAANMIRCTAATQLTFTVGTADLTAGVVAVVLRYSVTA
ncbi:MAG: hypothetical protein ACYSTZ_01035 [Planctomycetota bacterium]|jgi:hypothetical protein